MTDKKKGPVYRRGVAYATAMGRIARAIWYPAVRDELIGTERVIVDELMRHTTSREVQCMEMYYSQEMTIKQIGEALGITPPTVCRNIQRGEQKVNRVVDFANAIMEQTRGGYQV